MIPGSSVTIERRCPMIRLKSVDLPTLGRPTTAIKGDCDAMASLGSLLAGTTVKPDADALSFCKISHPMLRDLRCLPVTDTRVTKTGGDLKIQTGTAGAEKLSVVMARRHLERSDVAILVIDATQGVTALDAHIGGYAHEAHRSIVIAVNKWDAIEKNYRITADFENEIREKLKFLSFAPIVFVSAKTGQRVQKLFGIKS